jgi:hypothetical protein
MQTRLKSTLEDKKTDGHGISTSKITIVTVGSKWGLNAEKAEIMSDIKKIEEEQSRDEVSTNIFLTVRDIKMAMKMGMVTMGMQTGKMERKASLEKAGSVWLSVETSPLVVR